MANVLKNAAAVVRRPKLGLEWANWTLTKALGREPIRDLHRIQIGGFNGFSEFHSFSKDVEVDELEFLRSVELLPGAVVDVGANLGLVSLLVNNMHPGRRIVAFEPSPSSFVSFETNVRRNNAGNIECHNLCISDHVGTVRFTPRENARANASIAVDMLIRVPSKFHARP